MNIEYAAGLIDGEGWIGITSRSRGETYEINLKDISTDPSKDTQLQPEDQIIVPD